MTEINTIHMKRFCLIIALLLGGFSTMYAQTATTSPAMNKLDSLAKQVQRYINEQQPDSLYALTDATFQKQISADQFRQISAQLNGQLGKWTSSEAQGMQDGVAKYKANFAMMTLDFFIGCDKNGKISTLLFKPAQ